MKTKIKKIESHKNIQLRTRGHGTFRVTGEKANTGERITIFVKGIRKDAERAALLLDRYTNNQIIYGDGV